MDRAAGLSDRAGASRAVGAVSSALLAVLLLCLPVAIAPATAADQLSETAFKMPGTPEDDGKPVDLDVTLVTADPAQPRPAVVLAHGFGGSKEDSLPTARTLARDGYAVIVYTARGFGASGGDIHLDDPAYEGADAVKLVDWAAARPEVAKQGADPVIGFAGASYGGALALIAAGLDQRVDAIAPAFTWSDLKQALFPQSAVVGGASSLADIDPASRDGVFKQRWASLLFADGGQRPAKGGSAAICGRFAPELCTGYRKAAETGRPDADLLELLADSSPKRLLAKITAPTLLIQGEDDTLFGLDQSDATLRGLPPHTPAKLLWVAGGHDGAISIDDRIGDLEAWFGRYLKHDDSPEDTRFSVLVPATSLLDQGGGQGRSQQTLAAPSYPGRGSEVGLQWIGLTGDRQAVVSPPGGTPASLTNLPGTGGALAQASSLVGYGLAVLPGQSATFTSEPLTAPLTMVGSSRIDLSVTSDGTSATLFASVWDLGPDIDQPAGTGGRSRSAPSSAVLPGLAVAPIRLSGLKPGAPTPVTVALPAVAHQVPVGHRLQLVVSSTDQAYAVPAAAAVYQVALDGDQALALPTLAATPVDGSRLRVPLPLVIIVAALLLAAGAMLIIARRRRRVVPFEPELAEVPLAVSGVVKTYRDGVKAVDGVWFDARPGQVVGLLGPNGAGKTTLIRMIVGLIRPDAGQIYVQGESVHAGADVLTSVGAFIEGPGFLPHLTGMQNLTAYWAATGRPIEEARLEEALAIAGLGSAIDRRVRGYSQGMRQRLGIAQAMLGLPALLILDEPTNGLDPPQIKAMRAVLHDYAAAGRTVVLSSHLLSEVEHTCSHVVVMDKGKVVLTGSVAELTASDSVTVIELSDADQLDSAGASLRATGLQAERDADQLRVVGERPRSEIVSHLVGEGFGVESVDGHRQLEEVFLSLVGSGQPAAGERS